MDITSGKNSALIEFTNCKQRWDTHTITQIRENKTLEICVKEIN